MSWINAFIEWFFSMIIPGSGSPDNEKVTAIQAKAVEACGFLPMYDSVVQLLASAFPPAVTVSLVANTICRAVNEQQLHPVATLAGMVGTAQQVQSVVINGVVVKGTKVK